MDNRYKLMLRKESQKFYKGYRIEQNSLGHFVVTGYSHVLKQTTICGFYRTMQEAKQAINTISDLDGGTF